MFYQAVCAAIGLAAISTSASAQGITGGELTIDGFGFNQGNNDGIVNYSGALEFGINRNFSIAGDVAFYDFSFFDDDVTNFTLHGIYHLDDSRSIGLLVGNDREDGDGTTFFGLEGGLDSNQLTLEGYAAVYDNSSDDIVLEVSGDYQLTGAVSAIGTFGYGDIGNDDITRISGGVEYAFQTGPSLYAEIGHINTDGADSEFIGLGAKIEFGAARGTTFDRRGISPTLLPFF
ncbi:hypothetical protein OAH97_00050 [Octadecabacter sp.]|nr:hypothetical protein [Octadecabacter sp.]